MDAYDAFSLWHGLHLHFTTDYDWFKYLGVTRITQDYFSRRKDKYNFYKLSRKYGDVELQNFYVANFLYGQNVGWSGNLLKQEAVDIYRKWCKTNQSLTYTFKNDIINLLDSVDNPESLIVVPKNGYPQLFSKMYSNDIALETLIIMDDLMGFMSMWSNKLKDDFLYPSIHQKCLKYKPFLDYDKIKFKNILSESLQAYKVG